MTAINPASSGARQHEALPPSTALAHGEPGFLVSSPCERQWFVPFVAVAGDYADFLVQADGLSRADALAKVRLNLEFVPTWFYEQCASWADVERLGRLTQRSTLFKTKSALDRRRGSFSNADVREEGIEEAAHAADLPSPLN